MKIAIRGGHNFQAIGAKGILCETTEGRKVKDSTVKYLKSLGHNVLDVTPGNMDSQSDLEYGVGKANEWGADIFISIHFNKAYNTYNGAIGNECWIINTQSKANEVASRICSKLSTTGLKNRGVKHKGFYELKYTKMPAVIVETCFVEATEDVKLYKTKGADEFGKLIAEAIVNTDIANDNSNNLFRVRIDGNQIGAYSKLESIINALEENFGANLIEIEKV